MIVLVTTVTNPALPFRVSQRGIEREQAADRVELLHGNEIVLI